MLIWKTLFILKQDLSIALLMLVGFYNLNLRVVLGSFSSTVTDETAFVFRKYYHHYSQYNYVSIGRRHRFIFFCHLQLTIVKVRDYFQHSHINQDWRVTVLQIQTIMFQYKEVKHVQRFSRQMGTLWCQ